MAALAADRDLSELHKLLRQVMSRIAENIEELKINGNYLTKV